MTNVSQSRSAKSVSWMRRVVTYVVLLLIGFMLGFVPMWIKSRGSASSLSEATSQAGAVRTQNTLTLAVVEHKLNLATMQNTLASAAIDARRGDYESARQSASSFFTSLRAEANKGDDSSLSQAQKSGVEPVFTRRDEIISLLARSDPAAAERLSDLYVSFRDLMSK
jgi:hypothetical protein